MKNQLWLLIALLLSTIHVHSQDITKSFTWQGIITDDTGNPVASQLVNLRIGIREGTATGNLAYRETHQVTTSSTGQVGLEVGSGQPTTGSLAAIDWTATNHFQEVEIDITGGTNFQSLGTSPIRPIPLAIDVLNKNESIKTLNTSNYQSVSFNEKDRIHVEEDITIGSYYNKLNVRYLQIYGGGFVGTSSSSLQTLDLGNNVTVTNTNFQNIRIDGEVTFYNCNFSGSIQFPFGAKLINCTISSVTATTTRIDNIENSYITNSSIPRLRNCSNTEIDNSTIGSPYSFNNNDVNDCIININTSCIINNNQFGDSKLDIKSVFGDVIISSNVFDDAYTGHSEIINIAAENSSLKKFKIDGNTFSVQSSISRSINILGNSSSSYSTLNITNNEFYNGNQAITYSSNINSVISNNQSMRTSLGVTNNNSNLRVFNNIQF